MPGNVNYLLGPWDSTHPTTFVTASCVYFPLVSVDKIHCEIISELKCKMFREGQTEKHFALIGRNLGTAIRLAQWEASYVNRMSRSGRMIWDGHVTRMVEVKKM